MIFIRNINALSQIANFVNYGRVAGRKRLKDEPGVERLREELKLDLIPVLSSKTPQNFLPVTYREKNYLPPIEVTANGGVVGYLLLNEKRITSGLTTLEFPNGQKLIFDCKISPLDEFRAALYSVVSDAILSRRIGKLRRCPRCGRLFVSKLPRQVYYPAKCTKDATRESAKHRVKKWRNRQRDE